MPSRLRTFALWLPVFLLAPSGATGATLLTQGYSMEVRQTDDGLPDNIVTSAVQTPDGYLWLGTFGGLARFDGERFQVFDSANTPQLGDNRVNGLFADAQGTLWIGQVSGAITRYRDGRFEAFEPPGGTIHEPVIALGADAQDRLWAMRFGGGIDSPTTGQRLHSIIGAAYPGAMGWTRGRQGDIWIDENGRAARLVGGTLQPLGIDPASLGGDVHCVAAAADGGVWLVSGDHIREWRDGRWTEDLGEYPWADTPVPCCLELSDGTLAIGTVNQGLYLVFRDHRPPLHFDQAVGLPQNWIRFLYQDREGNLWAGTGSAGLVALRPSAFSVLNPPDRWRGRSVLCIAPGRQGDLWIGTEGAALYHYQSGQWTHYGPDEGLANVYIWAVTEGPEGEVWAGNYWWGGPYRLEHGTFVRPPWIDPASSPVLALVAGPQAGELIAGTRDGLLKITGSKASWIFRAPTVDICTVARDRTGAIWFGMAQGGLGRIADNQPTFFRRGDGLGTNAVQCLYPDSDGSLWVGTADHGLIRYKAGKFAAIGTAQGLADDAVCHISDDGLGNFWLSTRHGLQRVAEGELNRCADGAAASVFGRTYDREDGLPTAAFTGGLQGAGCRTADGRLWFATSKGVVTVDPARIRTNPIRPPVVIEALLVDGKPEPIADGAPLRLPADHQRLEIQFTALSFVAPGKVRFRYRLDGIDGGWVDVGARRIAYYSQLPAGHYRFRVMACNDDGLWNTEGAELGFAVAPFYWQTWWFRGLAGLLAVAAIAGLARQLTRQRVQRNLEQLERQRAVERERARIAQDIHDDLGVSLTRIAMFSQPDRGELADPQQTAAALARIYATSREATQSLDEIVWAIDPKHDTLDSLVTYMSRFAQELLAAAHLRCRFDLPVDLPAYPLTAEIRHNLFLAFEEALNNALRHAAATEVRISLDLLAKGFALVIQDDGRGFDPKGLAAGADRTMSGHGLPNLHRRLSRIGGRCEITSQPGRGTRVSLIVRVANLGGQC